MYHDMMRTKARRCYCGKMQGKAPQCTLILHNFAKNGDICDGSPLDFLHDRAERIGPSDAFFEMNAVNREHPGETNITKAMNFNVPDAEVAVFLGCTV